MFRKSLAATAALIGLAIAQPAAAQSMGQCAGRVFIDAIYQNGLGGNEFAYFYQIRNGGPTEAVAVVEFGGFGNDIRLNATRIEVRLAPFSTLAHQNFGRGINGNVTQQTVGTLYDGAPAGGAHIRVSNCRY